VCVCVCRILKDIAEIYEKGGEVGQAIDYYQRVRTVVYVCVCVCMYVCVSCIITTALCVGMCVIYCL
jgi:hypothetical protein